MGKFTGPHSGVTIKVVLREPIIKSDEEGNWLHVSLPRFNKNPGEIWEVPDTVYWRKEAAADDGRYRNATLEEIEKAHKKMKPAVSKNDDKDAPIHKEVKKDASIKK